jgi:hypothetical protein
MKKIQTFIAAFLLLTVSAFVFVPASPVNAQALDSVCATNPGESAVCENKDEKADGFVGTLVNLLLYIVGAVSVVTLIIGGVLYTLSAGNSSSVAKAKNTITYAIVGIVVSVLAYAIVNWVFDLF